MTILEFIGHISNRKGGGPKAKLSYTIKKSVKF